MWTLWLDDLRDPPVITYKIARNSKEAILLVKKYGIPTLMCLDHDLGGKDTAIIFIDWLINSMRTGKLPKEKISFTVHSMNPVGKTNIYNKINDWNKEIERKPNLDDWVNPNN